MRRSALAAVLLALLAPLVAGGPGEEDRREVVYVPQDRMEELLGRHGRGIVLTVEEYLALWQAARDGRFAGDSSPPSDAVVLAGRITGTIGEDAAAITADYVVRVLREGIVRVPFDFAAAGVVSATADDREALFTLDGGLLLQGKGDHRVKVELAAKVARAEDVRTLALRLPVGAATWYALALPGGAEPVPGVLGGTWRTEAAPGATIVTGHLPPGMDLALSFRARRDVAESAAYLTVEGRTLHTVGSRLLATVSIQEVAVLRHGVRELVFLVPADVTVTEVSAPGLAGWSAAADGRVTLHLSRETAGTVRVALKAERTLAGPGDLVLPEVRLAGAADERGKTAVRFEAGVTGRVVAADGFARVPVPAPAPQQKQGNARPPADPDAVLFGAVAAYRYWSADRKLTARTEAPVAGVDAEVDVAFRLLPDARTVDVRFVYRPRGERLFALAPVLPALYAVESVTVEAPAPSRWEPGPDGRILVTFPGGCPPDTAISVTVRTRLDAESWRDEGWTSTDLPLPVADPGVSGWVEGRLAVFAAEEFEVREGELTGLKPESVERVGAADARLAYRWRGAGAEGRLLVTRRDPKVTVRHVAFVAPGEKVARYTGFLHYSIQRAGVRKFSFDVSGTGGARFDVAAPLGVEAVRRPLPDGSERFEVTLPERVLGEVILGLSMEAEMAPAGGGRAFSFPAVRVLGVEDEAVWLGVESGDNMEIAVTASTGLRKIGLEEMVIPAGFTPSRGLVGAWQAAAGDWSLSIRAARFADRPVLTAFVTSAEILSVVAADGTVRSRGVYRMLNNGRQFLTVRLPEGSALWSAYVSGAPVKPAAGADGILVPLGTGADEAEFEVSLTWETPGRDLGSTGDLDLAAPELVGVVGAEAEWRVWLPGDYRVLGAGGVFGAEPPAPRPPWIVRALDSLLARGGKEMAASGPAARIAVTHGDSLNETYTSDFDAEDTLRVQRKAEEQPPPAGPAADPGLDRESRPMPAPAEKPGDPGGGAPSTGGGGKYTGPGGEVPPGSGDLAKAPETLPARLGKAGALPIDVPLPIGGTLARGRALGIRGSLRLSYVDAPARERLAWFLTVVVVLGGLLLTGQLRRGGPKAGLRIPPLVFVVGVGGFATFAPAWFGARDPGLWDGVARGAVLTLAALAVVRLARLAGSAGAAAKAAAALLFVVLLAPAARAEGERVYVPYDPEHLESLDRAGKVFLPFEEYQALWNAAHPDRAIGRPEDAPVPFVLTVASYSGAVEGETARVRAEYDLVVLSDGWVEVELPVSPAVVEAATVDGEPVRVLARGGVQVLVLEGKGARRVAVDLRVLVAAQGDSRTVTMGLPSIPRSRLAFELPAEGLDVTLDGPAAPKVDGRSLLAWLGPKAGFTLSWRPKTEAPRMEARVEVESRQVLAVLEGRVEVRLRALWRVVSGTVRTVAFDLPEGYEAVEVAGKDVKSWSVAGRRLEAELSREVGDQTSTDLVLLRADGARSRSVALPGVAPLGAVREIGVLAVVASPDLRVAADGPRNLDRIAADAKDFAGLIPAGAALHSAWRFVLRPLGLTVATEPVTSQVRAEILAQHLVSREWLRSVATFKLSVRGDGAWEFPVRVPADVELVSVTGAALDRWWRDGERIVLATANPVRGTLDVRVEFRRRLEPDAVRVDLPELHAFGVERETGAILVAHEAGLTLTLLASDGLVAENVAGYRGWTPIDPAQSAAYAWRADGGSYALAVARSFPKARVRPISTTRLQVLEDSVVVDANFAFSIENAGQDVFRVFFPEGEGADPIVVAERTREVKWEDATLDDGRKGRMLTVTLQQPATGAYSLRVVWEKRLVRPADRPREGTVAIRGAEPEGASAVSFVMIENQSAGEVLSGERTGLDVADPTGFPYLPAGLDPDLLLLGLKGKAAGWSLGLTLVIHDFAQFPDALVSSAEIVVAVGRDGWTRNRATWQVLNRTRQFLDLTLPPGSTLESVRVGGKAVKPGSETVDGEDRIKVPLARMEPGDVSTTVEVYWSRLLDTARPGFELSDLGKLDVLEPKLHGFEVEQTFVTVCLPEGYAYSFDGNMQPVLETAQMVWGAEQAAQELERLADVQNRGSFGQKVRATDNYYERRADVEKQVQDAFGRLRQQVAVIDDEANLAALDKGQREQLRMQVAEQTEKLRKLEGKLGLLDQTVAGQTAEAFNYRSAQAGPANDANEQEETLTRANALLVQQKDQEYNFKGKKNVVAQDWARNDVPAGQRDPADPQPPPEAPARGQGTLRLEPVPNVGGGGGGSGGSGYYDYGQTLDGRNVVTFVPEAQAGLLSLPVTVPERGQVYRFEKRNGGAELEISVSRSDGGRGLTGFGLFVITVGLLLGFYRWRPHERYRGFAPVCLIAGGVLLGVLFAFGPFLVVPVAMVVVGSIWLYRRLRKPAAA